MIDEKKIEAALDSDVLHIDAGPDVWARIREGALVGPVAAPASVPSQPRLWERWKLDMRIELAAACLLLLALVGTAVVRNLAPGAPAGGDPVKNVVIQPPAQGGGALELPEPTGDPQTDAGAMLQKFYALLNEKQFSGAVQAVHGASQIHSADLEIQGAISYTYQRSELVRIQQEFLKTPGDTIVMKVLVTLQAVGTVESPIYQPGENTIYVQMVQGGDGRWGIADKQHGSLWVVGA